MLKLTGLALALCCAIAAPASAQVQQTPQQILFYTTEWKGERFPDGRPKVSDAILKRFEAVNTEEAWGILRSLGYNNQFDGGFETVNDRDFVGRALTAQYMPMRPDMNKAIEARARQEGHIGPPNAWPIDKLQRGDVYVGDGYGKIIDGTLIGDILGNSIFAKSGTGVVFDAGARDVRGLAQIEGFNAFVRGFDPSAIREMQMTNINVPVRIGRAIVLPGDIVLAKREGVVFIPAHLAEQVLNRSEFIMMSDAFSHQMVRSGRFTTGQMDQRWTPDITAAFRQWVDQDASRLKMSRPQFEELMKTRQQ